MSGPFQLETGKLHASYAIPMILHCPQCGVRHIDEAEFAEVAHHTHACQGCGFVWRPAKVNTHGVQFLPGYSNAAAWNTRSLPQAGEGVVDQVSEIIYDYLDERFPDGAPPGGKQLFADDHLDAEFKHEAGCDELAARIVAALPGRVEELEAARSASPKQCRDM